MKLEDVRRDYGMQDYYDNIGMKIYKLSSAIDNGDDLLIPVVDVITDQMIGYAHMSK